MLNISKNSIHDKLRIEELSCYESTALPAANKMMTRWLSIFLIITLICFFLPWTQNIQMKGKVTTLLPDQRPQNINSAIAGRIEKWYVREGDLVQKGDTLVFLSEIKSEYFDPQLVERTANQVQAKKGAIQSYQSKVGALNTQINAFRQEQQLKKEQVDNKLAQVRLKITSNEASVQQTQLDYEIAQLQLKRTDTLYQKGIKSLNEVEGKRLKVQSTEAKWVSAKNKLAESKNELQIVQLQLSSVDQEYANKIAKAESDKFSTLSTVYEAEGSLNKLENQYTNYNTRNSLYYVIAPQTGYITETIKSGIGEIIKEGETILTVVPEERELAVELYARPMDLPLLQSGQEVQLIFDGWQAFIISGWSDFSIGTYSGEIVAMDNIPNKKNEYRVLIKSNNIEQPFPEILRLGTGAQGIALLKDVPVWYEIWRQLNGFPADFYEENEEEMATKFKPPVKAVAK